MLLDMWLNNSYGTYLSAPKYYAIGFVVPWLLQENL